MNAKHTIIAVAVTGTLAALATYTFVDEAGPKDAPTDPTSINAYNDPNELLLDEAGPRDVASPPAPCAFTQGDVRSYEWESVDTATVDSAALGLTAAKIAPTKNTISNTFILTTRVIEVEDASSILLAQMSDVASSAVPDPDRLTSPFLLEVSRDCQLAGFAYLNTAQRGYAKAQQGLLYDISWSTAPETKASNATGRYRARTTTHQSDRGDVLTRSIDAYDIWPHQHSVELGVRQSTLEVRRLHSGGWFERAELNEVLEGDHIRLERSAKASRIDPQPGVLARAPTSLSAYTWEDLLGLDVEIPRPDPLLAARQEAVNAQRGVEFSRALALHNELAEQNAPIHTSWPPLRNWLEANPSRTHELLEELERGEMTDRASMTAFVALGDAHTKESKRALTSVMTDDTVPLVHRSRAILALIGRSDVGSPLAEQLGAYALALEASENKGSRALARQAILALGAMASMHPRDEETRAIADTTITRALASVSKPLNRRPIYGAIANIGDPLHLQLVADIPTHQDKRMRKAAARVFRRMDPNRSDAFVVAWLEQETSTQVKRELWDTLERQTYDAQEDPSDTILELAKSELDERPGIATRKSLILVLSRALERRPNDPIGIRPVMERAAAFELAQNSGLFVMASKHLETRALESITSNTPSTPSPIDAPATLDAPTNTNARLQ